MSLMIEAMESRVLLTAAASTIEGDLIAGTAALVTARADLKAAVKAAALDIKGFKTDVKGLKLTAAQKSALTKLEKAEAVDAAKLSAGIGKVLATGTTRGAQLESALKGLAAHPTNAKVKAKVAAALLKLQVVFSTTVISGLQSVATSDVSAIDADLTAVGTAIPSTQTTVSTTTIDLSNDITTFSTDATSIVNVISELATDLT